MPTCKSIYGKPIIYGKVLAFFETSCRLEKGTVQILYRYSRARACAWVACEAVPVKVTCWRACAHCIIQSREEHRPSAIGHRPSAMSCSSIYYSYCMTRYSPSPDEHAVTPSLLISYSCSCAYTNDFKSIRCCTNSTTSSLWTRSLGSIDPLYVCMYL